MTEVAGTASPAPAVAAPAARPAVADSSPSVHRLAAFSDGVFAIAVTLLVFQLKVPQLAAAQPARLLAGALWHERATFLSYGFSFAVMAVFWFGHHRAFAHITGHDQPLAWWNTAYLATIAFLPFASALLGRYPANPVAGCLYAATLATSLLLAAALWRHACRAGLVRPGLSARFARGVLAPALACAAIFAGSAAAAAITIGAAQALRALAAATNIVIGRAYRDARRP